MRACHVDGTRTECVLAGRLLRRGLLAVFTAVLVSVLAIFAVGHLALYIDKIDQRPNIRTGEPPVLHGSFGMEHSLAGKARAQGLAEL